MRRPAGIAFDCYGTLLRIMDDRRVTRRFLDLARRTTVPSPMTENVGLRDALLKGGVEVGAADDIERDAHREAASAQPIEGVRDALRRLERIGMPFVIASNLSREYAEPISRHFPGVEAVLSFETGAAKPDAAMYDAVKAHLPARGRLLMIGDSRRCDYDGAIAQGFDAVLITPRSMQDVRCACGVADVIAALD